MVSVYSTTTRTLNFRKFQIKFFGNFLLLFTFYKKKNFLCVSIVVDYAEMMSTLLLTTLTHVREVVNYADKVSVQLLTMLTPCPRSH